MSKEKLTKLEEECVEFVRKNIGNTVLTSWGDCTILDLDLENKTVGMSEHGEEFCIDLLDMEEYL